jgi:pyridoxal phosphate-dependent aminotransferase EpsN
MSNVTAGIGRGQIRVLDERVLQRRAVFERYKSAFASIGEISFMPELSNARSNRWLSACTIHRRAKITPSDLVSALGSENIESRPVWKPLHLQPLFEEAHYFTSADMDVSKAIFETGICLPSGSNLSQADQDKIISLIKDLF